MIDLAKCTKINLFRKDELEKAKSKDKQQFFVIESSSKSIKTRQRRKTIS